jgi:hypothetical protein
MPNVWGNRVGNMCVDFVKTSNFPTLKIHKCNLYPILTHLIHQIFHGFSAFFTLVMGRFSKLHTGPITITNNF